MRNWYWAKRQITPNVTTLKHLRSVTIFLLNVVVAFYTENVMKIGQRYELEFRVLVCFINHL